MKISLFFSVLLLASCAGSVRTEQIDYSYLFHGGNSKVWMVKNQQNPKEILDKSNIFNSEWLIFYESGKVLFCSAKGLASKNYQEAELYLDSDKRYIEIQFPNKTWSFVFEPNSNQTIYCRPTSDSDFEYSLELIPLPEPQM
jgi:hypothetical protein